MSFISIIVAVDQNNAIGIDNELLCYLPNDLKHFKKMTSGHTIIMGRKTFESLPKGALPNRRNIVLSRTNDFQAIGVEVATNIEEALAMSKSADEVFIIGGASVYAQVIDKADRLYVTYIEHEFERVDSFFPKIETNKWREVKRVFNDIDDKNSYQHSFVLYERINNESSFIQE